MQSVINQDGNVVWDSYKDDKTLGKENWKTLYTIKANDKFEQTVWYANIDKDLSGEYEYEFYFTGSNLEDVPHLTGKFELIKGKFDRIRVIK